MRASSRALRAGTPALLAGLAHALLMFLAFPPVGAWPAAFAAILPLALAAAGGATWRTALLVSLGVLPLWLYELSWLMEVTVAGYPPLCVALALFPGLFVWLLARVVRAWGRMPLALAVPVLWTGVEFLRGEVLFTGFAWMLVGYPLIDAPALAMPATLLGVYFVSFLVAGVAGSLADLIVAGRGRVWWALAGPGLYGASVLAAWMALPAADAQPRILRAAVVQTNLPQSNKIALQIEDRLALWERMAALTRGAARAPGPVDFIVWPETMFPGIALNEEALAEERRAGLSWRLDPDNPDEGGIPTVAFADALIVLQREIGIPILAGAEAIEGLRIEGEGDELRIAFQRRYNSVFLIRAGRIDPGRYDKVYLTPFGEIMPYIRHWPWLQRRMLAVGAEGMSFNLESGRAASILRVPVSDGFISVAAPICFEITKASVSRRLAGAGGGWADVLVNLTNDGWFMGFDPAREQHLQIARWRSLEMGLPMVRAANTGISALIDRRGRVLAAGVDAGRARVDGYLAGDLPLAGRPTPFAAIGEVFPRVNMAVACAVGFAGVWASRGRRPAGRGSAGVGDRA